MLFKSLTVISILAATVAADYASIVDSLATVDAQVAKLNSSVLGYDGNILLAIPVLTDTLTLEDDLKDGTKTAQNSANLTTTDAINLVGPVSALARDTNITLTSIINKYSQFKSSGLDGIVKNNLVSSKEDADAYSAAIISKVPASLQSVAQQIAAPIDASFAQAIAVYSQESPLEIDFLGQEIEIK